MRKGPRVDYIVDILNETVSHMRFLSEQGCTGLECSDKSLALIQSWGNTDPPRKKPLSGIYNKFLKCRHCSLSKEQQKIVCGDGNAKAVLAIVGGAASPDDMQAGKPYSGAAGDLLNKMLKAMHLTREQVYITRAVKCCLPVNERPKTADIKVCRSYLVRELGLIRPAVICAFGELAARSLLESSESLLQLRGHFHDFKSMRVMPTFSPEYLLENPDAKRMVWEDLKQVMHMMQEEKN